MAYKLILNEEQIGALNNSLKTDTSVKIYRRLLAVYILHKGYKKKDAAKILDVSQNTITTWLKMYLHGGLTEIEQLNYNRQRSSKLDPYKEKIIEFIKKNNPANVTMVQSWLKSACGLTVEHSWLFRYCRDNNLLPVNG